MTAAYLQPVLSSHQGGLAGSDAAELQGLQVGRGEDVAHFDVVDCEFAQAAEVVKGQDDPARSGRRRRRSISPSWLAAFWQCARHGCPRKVQGVHAEAMRQLVSLGGRDFSAFSEVRAICEQIIVGHLSLREV